MISVVAIGTHRVSRDGPPDPSPFLPSKKVRKFLGPQDDLAVVACSKAVGATGPLGRGTGLYMSVGYIPFEERDARPVLERSRDARGVYSDARFGSDGYTAAHPLLTFRCLPNMPAYHLSVCFGITGPYSVQYPNQGQLALALEEATSALVEGEIDRAIVGGVAFQRNFLVRHQAARSVPAGDPEALEDAAAFVVLARGGDGLASLEELVVTSSAQKRANSPLGPSAPLFELEAWLGGSGDELRQDVLGDDGVGATIVWRRR